MKQCFNSFWFFCTCFVDICLLFKLLVVVMVEIYDKAEMEQHAQFAPIRLVCSLKVHVLEGVVPKGDGYKKPYNI